MSWRHPLIEPLAFLLGEWKGEGQGLWEAESPFTYREHLSLTAGVQPFLTYRQATFVAGKPRHVEVGYLRPVDGGVELVVVQPTGIVEVHAGSMVGGQLDLQPVSVARAPSALNVTAVRRRLRVDETGLTYLVEIAMNGEELVPHLTAHLTCDRS